MASVNIILFKSKLLKDGTHPIVLRITKNRKRKYISLGYNCTPAQWSEDVGQFNTKFPSYKKRNRILTKELFKAEDILDEFLDDEKDFTLEDFKLKYIGVKPVDVFEYFDELIDRLIKSNRLGTAESYTGTKKAIWNFYSRKLKFNEVDYAFLIKFENHCRNKGNQDTTIGVYMRTFRAVINSAIKERKCKESHYPFKEYKISKLDSTTKKRAIKKVDIEKVKSFVPNPNSKQLLSQHLFLFSYYNMGMNFIDMALLKWSNIKNGRIDFNRSKTGVDFSIKILAPIQNILTFYKKHNRKSEYIFPILDKNYKTEKSIRQRIKSGRKKFNAHLKLIAEQVGIEERLTSYVARHSWATIMKRGGISTSMISEMMGHSTEKVTQSYLDSFENDAIDKANELLL